MNNERQMKRDRIESLKKETKSEKRNQDGEEVKNDGRQVINNDNLNE